MHFDHSTSKQKLLAGRTIKNKQSVNKNVYTVHLHAGHIKDSGCSQPDAN